MSTAISHQPSNTNKPKPRNVLKALGGALAVTALLANANLANAQGNVFNNVDGIVNLDKEDSTDPKVIELANDYECVSLTDNENEISIFVYEGEEAYPMCCYNVFYRLNPNTGVWKKV
jgi:hypothetical protein